MVFGTYQRMRSKGTSWDGTRHSYVLLCSLIKDYFTLCFSLRNGFVSSFSLVFAHNALRFPWDIKALGGALCLLLLDDEYTEELSVVVMNRSIIENIWKARKADWKILASSIVLRTPHKKTERREHMVAFLCVLSKQISKHKKQNWHSRLLSSLEPSILLFHDDSYCGNYNE